MAFSYGFSRDEEQNKRGGMQSYFGGQQKPDTRMAQPKTQNVNPAQFRQQPATYGAATQKAPSYGAPAYSGATQKAPSYQAPAYGGTSKTSSAPAPAYSTAPTAAGTSTSSRATAAPASTMQAYFDQSAAPAYGDIGAGYGKGKSAIEQALGGMFDSTGKQVGTTGQSGFYSGDGFGVPQDQGTSYSASGAVAPTNVKPTTLESPADPNAPPSTTPFIQATPGLGSETADKFANTAGGLKEFVDEKLGRYKQTPASQQESGATGGAEGGVFGDKAGSVLSEENEAKYPGDTSHQEQSKAIGQALLDAIYGKAQYGVDPEVLNANMVALQREADKAKIAQNQMLGARGFGASGVAAADLGSIQSAANAKKADIAYQNAIDAAKQRNEMILGLGNMSLQDYQLSQALENQKEADKWSSLVNMLSTLGLDKLSANQISKYFKNQGMDDASNAIDAMFGKQQSSGLTEGNKNSKQVNATGAGNYGFGVTPADVSQDTMSKLSSQPTEDMKNKWGDYSFQDTDNAGNKRTWYWDNTLGWHWETLIGQDESGHGVYSTGYINRPEQMDQPAPPIDQQGENKGYDDGNGHWWYYDSQAKQWTFIPTQSHYKPAT